MFSFWKFYGVRSYIHIFKFVIYFGRADGGVWCEVWVWVHYFPLWIHSCFCIICWKDYPFRIEFLHPLPTEFHFCWKLAGDKCVWFVSRLCLLLICYVLVAQRLKRLLAAWETWVQSLGQEDPLEKEMAPHSSIVAWRIPWTEEPGRL